MTDNRQEEEYKSTFLSNRPNLNEGLTTAQTSLIAQSEAEPQLSEEKVNENIEELFESLGGFSRFQVFAYIAIVFGMAGPNFFSFTFGYLTQKPDKYICTYTDVVDHTMLANEKICTVKNICDDDPRIATWEADPNDAQTLYNWQ